MGERRIGHLVASQISQQSAEILAANLANEWTKQKLNHKRRRFKAAKVSYNRQKPNPNLNLEIVAGSGSV